jgi:hypothetical protein
VLIHSVVEAALMTEPPALPKLYTQPFSDGLLEGYDSGKDFIISRIISTNPAPTCGPI